MSISNSPKPDPLALYFHEASALLRNFVENSAVPTFLAKADDALVYANRAFADLLGYEPSECIGLGISSIIHPDDAAAARAQIATVMQGKTTGYQAERRYIRKNGEPIWVLVSASVLFDSRGRPLRLTVQAVNIDRQKRAEAALAESESRWNFALESAGQGVWDHDLRNKRNFYSRMWKQMRGLDPDEEIHERREEWFARVHPEDRDRMRFETAQQDSGQR